MPGELDKLDEFDGFYDPKPNKSEDRCDENVINTALLQALVNVGCINILDVTSGNVSTILKKDEYDDIANSRGLSLLCCDMQVSI